MKTLATLMVLLLLGGCTLLHDPVVPAQRPVALENAPFVMNGRIAVRYQQQHNTAEIRWSHQPDRDDILLLAPLGKTVARIERQAHLATLDDGETVYQAENAEALMQEVLGWYLPFDDLRLWLLGAMPEAQMQQVTYDEQGRVKRFQHHGWQITYLKQGGTDQHRMPTKIRLIRGELRVLLLVDEWEWRS